MTATTDVADASIDRICVTADVKDKVVIAGVMRQPFKTEVGLGGLQQAASLFVFDRYEQVSITQYDIREKYGHGRFKARHRHAARCAVRTTSSRIQQVEFSIGDFCGGIDARKTIVLRRRWQRPISPAHRANTRARIASRGRSYDASTRAVRRLGRA